MTALAPIAVLGRYALYDALAAGGMATVHIARLYGAGGFTRTVAIKRLHPQLASDREFSEVLIDEARIVSRIHHPNVVTTLDVVSQKGELFVVMEYIAGESLSALIRAASAQKQTLPVDAVIAILVGTLAGLHAAHEARGEDGLPLSIVHRDVSPQNVLVGADGIARVLDFGIAKAENRAQQTGQGVIKGKLGYMPPEQVRGEDVDRRSDVYAAGVVLWEALTARKLFKADSDWATAQRIFGGVREPPSLYRPEISPALDEIVLRACAVDRDQRFPTAEAMQLALESLGQLGRQRDVRELVHRFSGDKLAERARLIGDIESQTRDRGLPDGFLDEAGSAPDAPASPDAVTGVGTVATAEHPKRLRVWAYLGPAIVMTIVFATAVLLARRAPPALPTPAPSAPVATSAPAVVLATPEPAASSAEIAPPAPPPSASSPPRRAGPVPRGAPYGGLFDNRK